MTCGIAAYTFDPLGGYWTNPMKPFRYWDNHSVVVDPKTRSALHVRPSAWGRQERHILMAVLAGCDVARDGDSRTRGADAPTAAECVRDDDL